MLKADFHLHVKGDPGHKRVPDPKKMIDKLVSKGFEVASFTCHDKVVFDKKLEKYAKKKGLLLIPGCEKTIEGKHVLLINVTQKQIEKINTFEDLRKFKKKNNVLVIAPHPYFIFFGLNSLLGKLKKFIDLFDAIEYSHFYIKYFNLNKFAEKIANEKKLPLVGTSDCHTFIQLDNSYILIDSKKNKKSILEAVRKNKIELVTKPLTFTNFLKVTVRLLTS